MSGNIAYIGIGSNLGNALQNVGEAIEILRDLPDTRLDRLSSLYRTAPVDATGDDYVNAVARLITGLSPDNLLHALWNIENRLGRERPFRNAPRTLDLDILLYAWPNVPSYSCLWLKSTQMSKFREKKNFPFC